MHLCVFGYKFSNILDLRFSYAVAHKRLINIHVYIIPHNTYVKDLFC